MKRMLVLIALLFLLAGPAAAQRNCDKFISTVATDNFGPIEKVAGVGSQRVYLCGYMLLRSSGTGLDIELTSGTGINCGTATASILPRMTVPNGVAIVNRIPTVAEYTPQGHSLCLTTYGNGTLMATFYWTQF